MKKTKSGTKPRKKRNLGKFKSVIEQYCDEQLRKAGLDFRYEEKEYVLMEKFRYPKRYLKMTAKRKTLSDRSNSILQPIRYTPDFVAADESWVIETKGYLHSHHDFSMRWKLFLHYLVNNNMECDVYIPKNKPQIDQVIEDIIKQQHADNR